MRVLIFGDSITQGFWDTQGGWVQRLRTHYDRLEIADMHDRQPSLFNLGVSADTSRDVLKRLEGEVSARANQDTAIVFAIGTNNAIVEGSGTMWSEPEAYKQDLEELMGKAKIFTAKVMCVGLTPCDENKTTPVSWQDIYYTNQRLFEMETMLRVVCERQSVSHVPIFEIFQAAFQDGAELFADGLHPNDEGHQLMADIIRPELDNLLES